MTTSTTKNFVSELDQFLAEFDQRTSRASESQIKEIKKLSRVAKLRDDPEAAKKAQEELWEGF